MLVQGVTDLLARQLHLLRSIDTFVDGICNLVGPLAIQVSESIHLCTCTKNDGGCKQRGWPLCRRVRFATLHKHVDTNRQLSRAPIIIFPESASETLLAHVERFACCRPSAIQCANGYRRSYSLLFTLILTSARSCMVQGNRETDPRIKSTCQRSMQPCCNRRPPSDTCGLP